MGGLELEEPGCFLPESIIIINDSSPYQGGYRKRRGDALDI